MSKCGKFPTILVVPVIREDGKRAGSTFNLPGGKTISAGVEK
jgi:hypothetical protein